MSNPMLDAIAANFDRQAEAIRAQSPFQPDPELEQLGAQLDALRETDPNQYNAPGLAAVRNKVNTYRRRKANARQENAE